MLCFVMLVTPHFISVVEKMFGNCRGFSSFHCKTKTENLLRYERKEDLGSLLICAATRHFALQSVTVHIALYLMDGCATTIYCSKPNFLQSVRYQFFSSIVLRWRGFAAQSVTKNLWDRFLAKQEKLYFVFFKIKIAQNSFYGLVF